MKFETNRRAREELVWWWQKFLFQSPRALEELGWLLEQKLLPFVAFGNVVGFLVVSVFGVFGGISLLTRGQSLLEIESK